MLGACVLSLLQKLKASVSSCRQPIRKVGNRFLLQVIQKPGCVVLVVQLRKVRGKRQMLQTLGCLETKNFLWDPELFGSQGLRGSWPLLVSISWNASDLAR